MPPHILGLTGSIGMGKSTVASMFVALGVPVFDADAAVHRLYSPHGAAVAPLVARFSPAILAADGSIARSVLGSLILGPDQAGELAAVEAIVHPLVAGLREAFLAEHETEALVVLDIPLLFEAHLESLVTSICVVSTGCPLVQRARVLARGTMSEARFDSIVARQLPDADKRRRAHHIIETGGSLAETRAAVEALVAQLRGSCPEVPGPGGGAGAQ